MSMLTKERIEQLERDAYLMSPTVEELTELLRGYRASIDEAKHLEAVVIELETTLAAYKNIVTTYERMLRLQRNRLTALKEGV